MPNYQNQNKKMSARRRARRNVKPKKLFISPLALKASQMAQTYIRRRVKELEAKVASETTTRSDLRDLAKAAGMKNAEIGNQKNVSNETLIVRIAEAEVKARKPWRN